MEQLKQYYEVIQLLQTAFPAGSTLQTEATNLNQQMNSLRNSNAIQIRAGLSPGFSKISSALKSFDITKLTAVQEKILEIYNFSDILNGGFDIKSSKLLAQADQNPKTAQGNVQKLFAELNALFTKPAQIMAQLQPFASIDTRPTIGDDEGIIELVFDGDVSIGDFAEAKQMMNDWFLIVDGYSRLLGIQKTEFEIYAITKASPTKLKIKAAATTTALVLAIVSGLLDIEERIVGNKVLIEQVKQKSLAPDDAQKKFIKEIEKSIKETVSKEVDRIVTEKLAEYKIGEGQGDVETSLKKSVEKQYNFVVNGGEVNIYIEEEGTSQESIKALETKKEKVKELKQQYDSLSGLIDKK